MGVRAGLKSAITSLFALALGMSMSAEAVDGFRMKTDANPVDLPCRYQATIKIRQCREVADLTIATAYLCTAVSHRAGRCAGTSSIPPTFA
jgi:hypothetical protein